MANLNANKFRRGSSFNVSFPTAPSITAQPRAMELRQAQYEHDVVTLLFMTSSHLWFDVLKTGTAVQVNYGKTDGQKSWYGYVSSVSRTVTAGAENAMEIHCIGTTFPLKERATRVFTNRSIPDVVKEMVESFGFKFIGEPDSRIFEQLSMTGHSYWEWIQEQAKRIGYGVMVEGMNFVFRPLDKIINQGVTTVPTISFSQPDVRRDSQVEDRSIDFFKVSNGEYVENYAALRTIKHVGGVDPNTGTIIQESASPALVGDNLRSQVNDVLFNEFRTEQVVHDITSGISASRGAANISRMNMPAKVVCQGDVRIRPFYPVFVTGTGETTDGYWIPTEVLHVVNNAGGYQIRMNIGVDGTGLNANSEMRPGPNGLVGVVNLSEALANGENINSLSRGSIQLNVPRAVTNEKNQGFNRVGARWQYFGGRSN